MEELGERIQGIFCNCGKMFAGSREPYCYKDGDWLSNLSQYIANGCTVKMLSINDSFKLDQCICEIKIKLKTYSIDYDVSIDEFTEDELLQEIKIRNINGDLYGYHVKELLKIFSAIREEDIEPFIIEVNTMLPVML